MAASSTLPIIRSSPSATPGAARRAPSASALSALISPPLLRLEQPPPAQSPLVSWARSWSLVWRLITAATTGEPCRHRPRSARSMGTDRSEEAANTVEASSLIRFMPAHPAQQGLWPSVAFAGIRLNDRPLGRMVAALLPRQAHSAFAHFGGTLSLPSSWTRVLNPRRPHPLAERA